MAGAIDWVFFDIGSVLMDETAWIAHYHDHVYALLQARYPQLTQEMLDHAIMEGNERTDIITIRYVLDRFIPDRDEAVRLKRSYWQSAPPIFYELGTPADGALEVLDTLSQRYRLGVIANQHPPVHQWLAETGMARYLSAKALDCDLGVGKPDLRLFEHALELADCPPHRTVMVGDRLDNDIAPAKSLGMRTIRVQALGEYARFEPSGPIDTPDATVSSLRDIPGILVDWESAAPFLQQRLS